MVTEAETKTKNETTEKTSLKSEALLPDSNTSLSSKQHLLHVTEAAETHFKHLLEREDTPGMNLRISVYNPGTQSAEIDVTFCPAGHEKKGEDGAAPHPDLTIFFKDFTLFVDKDSEQALQDAVIDFEENATGGQLSIQAPFLKGRTPDIGSSLEERVQYVLEAEVNPSLGAHGGRVSLVSIEEGGIVVLRFGGGCHGCGMVNVTLKHGIEKTLKEKFPEITEVRDVTDHATGENPYY